jgi:hypothetical protein
MDQGELFAHVNNSIRKLAHEGPETQTWDFLCECADVACHAAVSLTLTEFDARRTALPPVPVIATKHDD